MLEEAASDASIIALVALNVQKCILAETQIEGLASWQQKGMLRVRSTNIEENNCRESEIAVSTGDIFFCIANLEPCRS